MKKIFKLLFALVIGLFIFLPIDKVNAEEVKHVVEFRSQGGSAVDDQYVVHGEKASIPYLPYKYGANFGGWYLDIPCEEPFDFDTPILEDTYLYAKWTDAIVLDEVRLYSDLGDISEGLLPEFTVRCDTPHVSVYPYESEYTGWATFGEYGELVTLTGDDLIAKANGNDYLMKVGLYVEPGYQVGTGTTVYFNDLSHMESPSVFSAYVGSYGIPNYVYFDKGSLGGGTSYTYNATFDYNGGSYNGNSTYTYNWDQNTYSFDREWLMNGVKAPDAKVLDYILVNGVKKTIPFTLEFDKDYTFKYVWKTAPKVKITFNPNGGKVSQTSKTVYHYSTYGTLPKPTRKGYTFMGWYTAKTGGTKIVASTATKTTKSRTLFARWSLTKYKITYNLNKGINNKKNLATYTMKTKTFSFKNPSRKGYIFKGWYTDKKFKKKITSIKKGSTGNKTIYAKWAAISYKVVYNANGGKGTMKASTGLRFDKTFTLRGKTFKRTGYKFTGWNTKKDGSGKTYADKAKVKNLTSKNGATVTLYAQWKKVAYAITYKLKGGTNNKVNPATYTVTSAIVFKNPTKTGYSFKGWYSDSNFKNRITGIAKGSTGDKVVYAKWKEITYEINYEKNGGRLTNVLTQKYFTVNDEVWLVEPDRDGYVFFGWYLDKEFTNKIELIPKGTAHDVTVYAKWDEESPHTIALYYAYQLLDSEPFSRARLIELLEQYWSINREDAVWAADNCGADWDANARLKAQDIYENYAFISYDLLILELEMSYVGFTHEQAVNAANYVDSYADWYAKALQAVNEIMKYENISRHELLEIRLKNNYMFTEEQALYGIEQANIDFEKVCLESAKDHLEWWSECPEDSMISYLDSQGFTSEEIEYAIEELY